MLSLRAPAKINWALFIAGRRDDGYHEIISLIQCIDLWDELSFEPFGAITLESDCPVPPASNLVWKAALLLKDYAGVDAGARITLKKNIPMEAGLGGGSSDAAFTLMGLNKLWGLKIPNGKLAALGAQLGSDVPFFFYGPSAIVTGRGEVVKRVKTGQPMRLTVSKPDFGVSSGWAYRALRGYTGLTKARDNIKLFIRALARRDYSALEDAGGNDLEPGVCAAYPEIGRMKAELGKKGAFYAHMSGSGSAVYGVFGGLDEAMRAASGMSWWSRAVSTITEVNFLS
ncbi:MAG: 4-(cytidine 5'-diphospho)-2-C-methyl-D-erythritol kinase [Nitrospiraceae bacterium]|nr:4-(cytidine 5'-diphospho)-2-C-methyl-D-erythritol kinase [Nitrospiraceae bacterium]